MEGYEDFEISSRHGVSIGILLRLLVLVVLLSLLEMRILIVCSRELLFFGRFCQSIWI